MKAIAILGLTVLTASFAAAQDPAVEQAIDALAQKYADGWKSADAAACASIYSDDADVIDFMGLTAKGKAAIQESVVQTLNTFKGSTIQLQRTNLHVVSPEVVVSDGTWEVVGGQPAEGSPTKGFYTVVVSKQGDGWQVVSNRTKVAPPSR